MAAPIAGEARFSGGRDPQTPEEWQQAADVAEFLLLLDSCRQYGLITGGPPANVERCVWILDQAQQRGILPEKVWESWE